MNKQDKKDKKKKRLLQAEFFKEQHEKLKNAKRRRNEITKQYKKELENLKANFLEDLKNLRKQKLGKKEFKQQKLALKNKYQIDRFNMINQRDYLTAKTYLTDRRKRYGKMLVDKRIAINVYKEKAKHALKIFNQQETSIKKEHQVELKQTKSKQKQIEINNKYELAHIQNKIGYKNALIKLREERDLSYEYELDTWFILKRWWYGVGKEYHRMTFPTVNKTLRDFFVVIAVSAIIAIVFLVIDIIFTKI
ncbi:MAG: preprotein translocase subunit SecE [Mycoplasma sp.]